MKSRFALTLVCLAFLTFSLAPAQERSRQKSSPEILSAFHAVVAKPSHSTVRVQCGDQNVALGTIVGPDGWILTKASQLKGPAVCVLQDGRRFEARVVGVQEPYDLALLKIDATGLTPVDWGKSKTAAVGEWVAAPGLTDTPVAVGVVSVAARPVRARDMPVYYNRTGGFLGVRLAEVADEGARIDSVDPNTPASRAGLKVDDLILSVAGQAVQDVASVQNTIQHHKPGEVVNIRVRRGGQVMELEAKLDRKPGFMSRGDRMNEMGGPLSERRNGFPMILQHDTVLRPSDCGGPLVDLDGKVVGINIARAGRTETYAAPAEAVLGLMYDLMSGKLAPKLPANHVATKTLTPEEKVARAQAAVDHAAAEKVAAERKLAEAKRALEKAQAEAADNPVSK
jgi:serine protease Do